MTKRMRRALGLCTALGSLIPAAAAADVPEAAPPAMSALHAETEHNVLPPDLAAAPHTSTASVGSTEGFEAASPGQLGGWGSGALDPDSPQWFSGTSGATGMWAIEGQVGTTFTIDSCGSSFPAQLAIYYRTGGRDFITSQAAYTSDGCADPIILPYGKLRRPTGLVRIDDASGAGGEYQVNYRRTPPETTPPRGRAFKPVVGPVRRSKGARRIGKARVSIDYRVVDADGSYPVRTRCVLKGEGVETHCNLRTPTATFRHVRSGRHTFVITASDAVGNRASFQRKFRVPYLKPGR